MEVLVSDFIDDIERREIIAKIIKAGYGNIVDAFLLNENECYTKKGRLNKSGACRVLGAKPKQLDDQFAELQRLLEGDLQLD
jgi:hypothetical protein